MTEAEPFAELCAVVTAHDEPFDTSASSGEARRRAKAMGLPPAFVELYERAGPAPGTEVPWVVEWLRIFALEELEAAQEGYAWSGSPDEPAPGWASTWVVVASVFGDPFFVDTTLPACPVGFARHGTGAWNPVAVAPSMAAFVLALAAFEQVLLGVFDRDVWDDDDSLRADFLAAVADRVGVFLSPEGTSNFLAALE